MPDLASRLSRPLPGRLSIRLWMAAALLCGACASLPNPAENDWARVTSAGLVRRTLDGSPETFTLSYVLGIEPKRDDLVCVDVADVSGLEAVTVVSGAEIGGDNTWLSEGVVISPQSLPWLFTSGPTRKLFRFVLYNGRGQTSVLEQSVLYSADAKARYRKAVVRK